MNELANSIEVIAGAISVIIASFTSCTVSIIRVVYDKKRHAEIVNNQKERNRIALEQNVKHDMLQESIEMSNGFKTGERVASLKHIAYGEQKLYFIREVISLYNRNNISLDTKNLVIGNLKVIVEKTISNTDRTLLKMVPDSFIASTQKKIQLINESDILNIIFNIFMERKCNNCVDMFGRIGAVYDQALGMIKSKMYNDDGRIKNEV